MSNLNLLAFLMVPILLLGCKPPIPDPRDYIDHWEINRTFKSYNHSTLEVDTIGNTFQVIQGKNQVLIVTVNKNPVFKPGKEFTDMESSKSLLIELDSSDLVVTASTPSNSKLFSQLIAMSPYYGIKPLDKNENIRLARKDTTVWAIESGIRDFVFKAELNFATKQMLTNNFIINCN